MPNLGQSLEDLLPDQTDEESAEVKLQEKMHQIELKEKEEETNRKANAIGLPYINLVGFAISPETLKTISKEDAKKLKAVCFLNNGKDIRLGAVDYTEEVKKTESELAEKMHANTSTYLISKHSLETTIKMYDTLPKVRKFISGVEITKQDLKKFEKEISDFRELDQKIQKASLTDLLTLIIAAAIKSRSSDIHIEAEEKDIKVRYRIDGVLNDVASLDKETWPKVASRIKQLAKLKINVADRPQDGRFSIHLENDRVDVRVSALPTAFGESIVIRLLMSSAANLSFDDLGLRGQAFKILEREIKRPNGMIVTTGPTGSGKTTTLYAILKKLNKPDIKIITIEDPIEYELEGINQSQVSKNYTFTQGLKSIVRQDPDIIMVGEIRDLDTAEISIQAALTGHLVLSTIHTNDAFGTIPRFLALGAKPFLLAPSLNAAIGQRLVRRLCQNCKKETLLNAENLARAKKILTDLPPDSESKINMEDLKFYSSAGCEKCQGLGYKGRIGIYEIMPIEGEIEQAIHKGNLSEVEIKEMAEKRGIITMVQDGLLKALDGITSVEEVFRVIE